ncbi:MAG: GNAT family N-acetyltransferase [Rubrobacter sp.]|nr:GNAT family N-acetyltransferase [Rubrobacter sp.]
MVGRSDGTTRPGGPEDLEFLWDMLYEAVSWRPEEPGPPRDEVLSDPHVACYLEGWGRPGDTAVVYLDPATASRTGAAWYRFMPPEEPGYGFVEPSVPELTLAVVPGHRGLGAGTALLAILTETARLRGVRALSLSVERDNPVLRLYEQSSFAKLFQVGNAWTMKKGLSAAGEAPG